jgi:hypothetical protein
VKAVLPVIAPEVRRIDAGVEGRCAEHALACATTTPEEGVARRFGDMGRAACFDRDSASGISSVRGRHRKATRRCVRFRLCGTALTTLPRYPDRGGEAIRHPAIGKLSLTRRADCIMTSTFVRGAPLEEKMRVGRRISVFGGHSPRLARGGRIALRAATEARPPLTCGRAAME